MKSVREVCLFRYSSERIRKMKTETSTIISIYLSAIQETFICRIYARLPLNKLRQDSVQVLPPHRPPGTASSAASSSRSRRHHSWSTSLIQEEAKALIAALYVYVCMYLYTYTYKLSSFSREKQPRLTRTNAGPCRCRCCCRRRRYTAAPAGKQSRTRLLIATRIRLMLLSQVHMYTECFFSPSRGIPQRAPASYTSLPLFSCLLYACNVSLYSFSNISCVER